jgi:hypothetical protein
VSKRDEFICGYAAAIADLYRLNQGSGVRAGELLRNLNGVAEIKGKGVVREDMAILRKIERQEGK